MEKSYARSAPVVQTQSLDAKTLTPTHALLKPLDLIGKLAENSASNADPIYTNKVRIQRMCMQNPKNRSMPVLSCSKISSENSRN